MIQQPRAVLWDMDGTLLDSSEYHWRSWREVLAAEGFQLTRELFSQSFGRRNDATLRAYFGEDFPLAEIERIGDIKEALYREMVRTEGVQLLPGIAHWLTRLKSDVWRQALASSASLLNIETIVGGLNLGDFFDAIVSAEDVETGKPDPSVFLVAAARVSVDPGRCVVVEDSPAGIEGARRAGMHSIAVRSWHSSLQADIVVRTLDELAEDAFDSLIAQ